MKSLIAIIIILLLKHTTNGAGATISPMKSGIDVTYHEHMKCKVSVIEVNVIL